MIIVKKLKQFRIDDEKSFGLNWFKTKEVYIVSKDEKDDEINISIYKAQRIKRASNKKVATYWKGHSMV